MIDEGRKIGLSQHDYRRLPVRTMFVLLNTSAGAEGKIKKFLR